MDTYLVTSENVVIAFRAEEQVEPKQVIAACLRARGLAVWPALEAEVYRGRAETLMLARPLPPVCSRGSAAKVRRRRR